jgi:transposase
VFGAFLGFVWSFARLFVPTAAGRQRFNVLGALNAVTRELTWVDNLTYVNGETVCQLLQKLRRRVAKKPITLVLDNARYQRCRLVQGVAAQLNIELLFLPPYSPNLNLIERLWKFVKKQALASRHHQDFASFTAAISACLARLPTDHAPAMKTLLTWNFQTFHKSQFMNN